MAVLQRAPAPLSTPISDSDQKTGKLNGYLPVPWSDYFNGLDSQLGQSYAVVSHAQVPNGSAPIGVTPITNVILSAGIYRVSYYVAELQADNVASSITVTIAWTDRGTSRFIPGAALTANSVNAAQTNTYVLRCDRATPITYSVTYSSTGGAPKLIYGLDVMLEQVINLP